METLIFFCSILAILFVNQTSKSYLSSLGLGDLLRSLLSSFLLGENLLGGLLARGGDLVRQFPLGGVRRKGDLRLGERSLEPGW